MSIFGNSALTDLIGLRELRTIEGHLFIQFNEKLQSVAGLATLERVGGRLAIRANRNLPSSAAQALAERLIAGGFTGEIQTEANQP